MPPFSLLALMRHHFNFCVGVCVQKNRLFLCGGLVHPDQKIFEGLYEEPYTSLEALFSQKSDSLLTMLFALYIKNNQSLPHKGVGLEIRCILHQFIHYNTHPFFLESFDLFFESGGGINIHNKLKILQRRHPLCGGHGLNPPGSLQRELLYSPFLGYATQKGSD